MTSMSMVARTIRWLYLVGFSWNGRYFAGLLRLKIHRHNDYSPDLGRNHVDFSRTSTVKAPPSLVT